MHGIKCTALSVFLAALAGGTFNGSFFIRGDGTADGGIDLADPILTLSHIFDGSTEPPGCPVHRPCGPPLVSVPVTFTLERASRVSLAVYDAGGHLVRELCRAKPFSSGTHAVSWDGLDGQGQLAAAGEYEWRLLETPGFRSRFVTTLGVNPSSGVHGVFTRNWVGDHRGPGALAADESGLFVGASMTEALMQTLKQSFDGRTRFWQQPQYYDGGRLTRLAAGEGAAFMVQPNGKLRRLDARTGRLQATWELRWDDEAPSDVDYFSGTLVVCYPGKGAVRWIDPGRVRRPRDARAPERTGTGLRATYYHDAGGTRVAFTAVEAPIYFDPFGPPPHASMPEPPYKVVWEGRLETPLTDRFMFEVLKASDESVSIWIDDSLLMRDDGGGCVRAGVGLTGACKHRVRIEYVNRTDRPELKFLWYAENLDKDRVRSEFLYEPESVR